jgi:hypothetical protein
MATQATYYLDAPSLSSATVIYSDINLTTVAADGFYSDGTIVREQVSGSLLPQNSCPSCATPCGGSISASGQQGIYYLSSDLGTDTGAVVITFDPFSVPDGVLAVFNSQSYNGLSSPAYGWLQGSAGLPTYIGATSNDCGVVANSPYTLDEFEYNGSTFAPLGTTTSVTILSGQLDFTVGGPGSCVMVIPKTTAAPSVIDLQFIGPCSGTAFNISVSCPTALTEFQSTSMFASDTLACAATINQSYYVAHVNGSAGVLGLYDLVFSDPNGEFKLSAGYYKTADAGANDWFQVDANGVIITFGTCASPGFATLDWNYTMSAISGNMDLYVNGSIIESRSSTSNGTWNVGVGDTINVQVVCDQCTSSPNTYANAYCTGIITDADCENNGVASIFTAVYTVVSGDIGNTLSLDAFSTCESACL